MSIESVNKNLGASIFNMENIVMTDPKDELETAIVGKPESRLA